MIRTAISGDAPAIASIYNHYVEQTVVTFEEEPVSNTEVVRRIDHVQGQGLPWLVAESAGSVVGFAYAGYWHKRKAYQLSVETTVYLSPDVTAKGLGSKLYSQLLASLREQGIHVVIGVIALPNAASVALHEKFGFTKCGEFREVGFKFNQWVDVGYWQGFLDTGS
jgi:L-amino acid N-acyltransferase YncA